MPEIISKYRIFLASPSDLLDERESITDVINELNLTYGNPNKIVLELLKWETNSAPSISNSNVQNIINYDIPTYDLFIGLLWMRFGTPTKEFGSGTEEEFNIAYTKFKEDNNSLQILFYFKNAAPKSLDDINPEQLGKVKDFKLTLGEKNVLFWDYNSKEELTRFLRLHIPTRIESLKSKNKNTLLNNDDILEIEKIEVTEIEEELGIIDYQEFIEEYFAVSTQSLTRISEATAWIGKEMNKKTAEINKLVAKNKNQQISFKVQRNIYERTSESMNNFANRIEPEIPIYINNFEKGIDSFSKLIMIFKSDFDDKNNEVIEASNSLDYLIIQIELSLINLKEFLTSIEQLPKMSKELNNAKKNVANKLSDFISKLEMSIVIGKEVHKNINI
jgi:mRNA-degrading endonuclease RelE of RelBE toxin-antitoxin system